MGKLPATSLNGYINNLKTEQHDNCPVKKLDIEIGQVVAVPGHGPGKKKCRKGEFKWFIPGTYIINLSVCQPGKDKKNNRKCQTNQTVIKQGFVSGFDILDKFNHACLYFTSAFFFNSESKTTYIFFNFCPERFFKKGKPIVLGFVCYQFATCVCFNKYPKMLSLSALFFRFLNQ